MEKDVASEKGTIEGTAPVRQATEGDGPKSSEDDFEHTLELQVAVDSLQAGNEEYLKHYLASREGLDPEQCTLRQTPWKAPPPEEEGGPSLHFIGELDNIQAPGEENESDTGLPNRREPPFIDFDRVEEPYRYEPLRGKRDIRLLRLGPKSDDGIIGQLELESFALDDAPRYFCLSYVWGNADQIMPMTCNGRLMMTTQNLYHALRTCFNRFDNVWLWADGICINQSDHLERAQQVMLMGEIYERAAMVLAHPGHYHYKPTDETKADELRWAAFDSAPEEMRVENTQEAISIMTLLSRIWEPSDPFSVKSDTDWKKYKLPSVETDSGKMTWARLVTFWGQDWFCRAWVLQELVLAKKVVVLYADTVLSLDAVMGFWEKARRHGLPRVLRIGTLADECARVVHLTPASYLKGLVKSRSKEAIPGLGDSSDDQALGDAEQEKAESIRLLDLLSMTRTSLATDERDKVYALLGLAQDEVAKEVVPDYSPENTTTCLFIDVARRLVQAGQGHELLHHAGADTRTPGLPSWVPDWTFQSRSALRISLYRCMGSTRAQIRILDGTRPKLAVRGVRLSKVKFAGMAWRYYSHDQEQPKFASFEKVPDLEIPPFNDEDGRNVILAMASLEVEDLGSAEKRYADEGISFSIAKTLAADCSWRGERIGSLATAEFSDAFEAFKSFYKRGPESEADLVQPGIRVHQTAIFKWLLDFDQAEEDELQRRMVPYTVSMQEASRGRRYAALGGMSIRKKRENKKLGKTTMEMDDRGFIANVPWNAEKKDLVVMFEGFATPFVVRETSSGEFELIGDCYVHGAMDGEILRDAEGLDLGEEQIGVDENGWKYCVRAPDGYTEFEDFVLV